VTPYVFRFLVGGLVVSAFAALGDVLKPKSFAGLFGAAPSIALATLGLTVISDGKSNAAQEARSMIAGAAAFFVYAGACVHILMKHSLPTGCNHVIRPRALAHISGLGVAYILEIDANHLQLHGAETNQIPRVCRAVSLRRRRDSLCRPACQAVRPSIRRTFSRVSGDFPGKCNSC
jgi:hypothetical protein